MYEEGESDTYEVENDDDIHRYVNQVSDFSSVFKMMFVFAIYGSINSLIVSLLSGSRFLSAKISL